jgi:proteasome accessory factor C
MTVLVETGARLRRLLAILAWLAQVGEAPIDDVAERFELTPAELVTELEMAACCGVPPYTPDQLMEIVVTDTSVSIRVGTTLARPRRLSPSEGFALATSARALLAVAGSDEDGALSRALVKLDRALGGQELEVELDTPALLPLVRQAVADRSRLAVTYYSASTDRVTEREISPLRLFATAGHWYVDAWCASADGVRRFRVDRIGSAEVVGDQEQDQHQHQHGHQADLDRDSPGEPVGDGVTPIPGVDDGGDLEPFVPGPDSRRVRISIDPSTAWLIESIPTVSPATEVGGRVEFEIFVGGDAWLERLLLRLGPDAQVVDPPEYRTLAADAAARLLERYR